MCNCKKNNTGNLKKTVPASPPPQPAPRFASRPLNMRSANSSTASAKKKNEAPVEDLSSLAGDTLAEQCQEFAYVLGLENPVPEKVLIAALEDPSYARRLLANRNKPHLRDLVDNPPDTYYGSLSRERRSFSNKQLIAKAGKALLKWGLSGFPTVSNEILRKREDACLACPNLSAPSSVLQKVTVLSAASETIGNRTGNKVCSVCGCVVRNKMRLATDTCPVEVAETPGLNRWGEAVQQGK